MRSKRRSRKFSRLAAWWWVVVGGCASLNSCWADAILLQLRNGDRLTGVIQTEDAGTVTLISPLLGKVVVPAGQIESRQPVPSTVVAGKFQDTQTGPVSGAPTNRAALVLAPVKKQRLEELLSLYRSDKITAIEYQQQRAIILAEAEAATAEQLAKTADITKAPIRFATPPGRPATQPDAVTKITESTAPKLSPNAPVPKASSPTKPTPLVAANAPKPTKPVEPKRKLWTFDAQLGMNLQYNQKENELYQGVFKVNYGDGKTRFRHIFNYSVNYGKTDGLLSANNMNGLVRSEMDVAKKFFLFNAAGAGYDEIRKIDLSIEESFGVGYTLLKRTNFVAAVDAGVNFQEQSFSDGTTKDYFSPRLGEKVTWKLSNRWEWFESFEYYPRSLGFDNYRLRFETTLRYLLSPYLNFNLTVIDLYDTQPAPGVTPNDLQIRSTVGLRF